MCHPGPVADFDAELYLRLRGERWLLLQPGRVGVPWDSPLTEAARALVAAGVIEIERARRVIDDYRLAAALRSGEDLAHLAMWGGGRPGASPNATPVQPRRVVPCDRVIERSGETLQVRYVSLASDSTRLGVTIRPSVPPPRQRRLGVMLGGHGPPAWSGPGSSTLVDDRGTRTSAGFSGGGPAEEWRGHLVAAAPLAADTAWVEVDGERIDLVDLESDVKVVVEPLPDEDPVWRHLWRRVVPGHHFHVPPENIEVAIEALAAAGALSAEDPRLDDLWAVVEARQQGGAVGARLPEPWRSLFGRRGRARGRAFSRVVGAVTPPFDGVSVAVMRVEATGEGFGIEVELAGRRIAFNHFEAGLDDEPLVWWAGDDLGNHYLGHIGHWNGGDGAGEGEISFWPPLDRRAARLDVMPTAGTARGVVRIPIPPPASGR